jgi:hypothetical protein
MYGKQGGALHNFRKGLPFPELVHSILIGSALHRMAGL